MANSKQLKTGNAGAQKPGKGASYVVTQEAFDVAFGAGQAYAGAYHAAAVALQPLLSPLSGRSDGTAVAQWKEYARGFALGMSEAREIDPDSARKAFNRLADYLGLTKPQTPEAAAKAAKRAAAKPQDAGDDTPIDGAGAEAADAVKMALSKLEAHLIGMLRAGKYEMAAQCVADMAAAK